MKWILLLFSILLSHITCSQNLDQLNYESIRLILTKLNHLEDKMQDMDNRIQDIQKSSSQTQEQCSVRSQMETLQDQLTTELQRTNLEIQQLCSSPLISASSSWTRELDDTFVDGSHTLDPCLLKYSYNCSENAECQDSIIGHRCLCFEGYFGDGFICEDIDECSTGDHKCDIESSKCINTNGSHYCECPRGYIYNGSLCEDIDECNTFAYICGMGSAICINTNGSYQCDCPPGYNFNNESCEDINECSTGNNTCDQEASVCVNTEGNYYCKCPPGYTYNGYMCEDVDECGLYFDMCGMESSECINMPGTYTCSCPAGYIFNGDFCTELQCPPPSKEIPYLGCVSLIDKRLTWQEAKEYCENSGGRLLQNLTSRQTIDELLHFKKLTDWAWVGLYEWRWEQPGGDFIPDSSELWRVREPNRREFERCGGVKLFGSKTGLFDIGCTIKAYSLCQYLGLLDMFY